MKMKNVMKKIAAVLLAATVFGTSVSTDIVSYAKGPTYTAMQDVYYTKDN